MDVTASELLSPPLDVDQRGERDNAANWLEGWLAKQGGQASRADVGKAAAAQGISPRTLQRAREHLKVVVTSTGSFPRRTEWSLRGAAIDRDDDAAPSSTGTTASGGTTGHDLRKQSETQPTLTGTTDVDGTAVVHHLSGTPVDGGTTVVHGEGTNPPLSDLGTTNGMTDVTWEDRSADPPESASRASRAGGLRRDSVYPCVAEGCDVPRVGGNFCQRHDVDRAWGG